MNSGTRFKMEVSPLPEVSSKVWIYKTIRPTEEDQKKQTGSLANSLNLKKGAKALSETPERFSVEEGHHVLETYKESGSIWYGDMSKLWQETSEPMDIKELSADAENVAQDFLGKHNLLPTEASFAGLEETEFAELKPGEEKATGETVATGAQVNFEFKLDDIPVIGPGAKINVTLGSDREVIGFFKAWREVEKVKEIAAISPKDVVEKFQNSIAFAELSEGSKVSIKKLYLGHYALPAFELQDYLLPVYVFEVEVETSDFEHDFVFFASALPTEELKAAGMLMDLGAFPLMP